MTDPDLLAQLRELVALWREESRLTDNPVRERAKRTDADQLEAVIRAEAVATPPAPPDLTRLKKVLASLEKTIHAAYSGSAEHGSFLRYGGGEVVPGPHLLLEDLRAALLGLAAVPPVPPPEKGVATPPAPPDALIEELKFLSKNLHGELPWCDHYTPFDAGGPSGNDGWKLCVKCERSRRDHAIRAAYLVLERLAAVPPVPGPATDPTEPQP